MNYKIISSGSKGNALIIDDSILIDCGVSYEKLKPYIKNIKLVLLTHCHIDHYVDTTIKKINKEKPLIRFVCCKWLVDKLVNTGVNAKNIDVLDIGKWYNYGICSISPILLYHNVDNCGYRLKINNKKVIYATDTNSMNGISAKDYDYYFIEANHIEEEIDKIIEYKNKANIYCYEKDAKLNHLSKEKCDKWLLDNMCDDSVYVYMHRHEERE